MNERATDQRWPWDQRPPLRWLLVDNYTDEAEAVVARCADIDGLFLDLSDLLSPHEEPDQEPEHLVTLLGCRPETPLRRALDALARGAGNPGGALHRRHISATIYSVATDGTVARVYSYLSGSVTGSRPSALGEGLLDVTFDDGVGDPLPSGARPIWDLWQAGRPPEKNLWTSYPPILRRQWTMAALSHHRHHRPDQPSDSTFHLDGSNVTDIEGFYCAIGEAVNGPGGYFGANADALLDCVSGRWGAAPRSRLIWHHSAVARTHLVSTYLTRPSHSFDQLRRWLTEGGVELELR